MIMDKNGKKNMTMYLLKIITFKCHSMIDYARSKGGASAFGHELLKYHISGSSTIHSHNFRPTII